jgi:hypothetical protein
MMNESAPTRDELTGGLMRQSQDSTDSKRIQRIAGLDAANPRRIR